LYHALQWLKNNNPLFENIRIVSRNIEEYSAPNLSVLTIGNTNNNNSSNTYQRVEAVDQVRTVSSGDLNCVENNVLESSSVNCVENNAMEIDENISLDRSGGLKTCTKLY